MLTCIISQYVSWGKRTRLVCLFACFNYVKSKVGLVPFIVMAGWMQSSKKVASPITVVHLHPGRQRSLKVKVSIGKLKLDSLPVSFTAPYSKPLVTSFRHFPLLSIIQLHKQWPSDLQGGAQSEIFCFVFNVSKCERNHLGLLPTLCNTLLLKEFPLFNWVICELKFQSVPTST